MYLCILAVFISCLEFYVTSQPINSNFMYLEQTWEDVVHNKELDPETGTEEQVLSCCLLYIN